MTAYPPAVAEMLARIEAELAEIEANRQHHEAAIAHLVYRREEVRAVRSAIMETAAACAGTAPDEPLTPTKRVRHNVRDAVKDALSEFSYPWSEAEMASRTSLPLASIHAYLLRAVRTGEVVRVGDVYHLPHPQGESG